MATVALCTPHADLVRPDYYRAILTMQNQFPDDLFVHVEVDTTIIGKARNMLVEAARSEKCEVVWFIDNDTLIPAHAGVLIKQAMDLGVVSGVYFNRRPPYHPQVFRMAEEPENEGMYWPLIDYPEMGVREEDATGAGCLLVRMDVFEELDKRWEPLAKKASLVLGEHEDLFEFAEIARKLSPWFEFLDRKGEDLYFCERIRHAGFPIWVNYEVKCIHIAAVGILEEHFKAIKDSGALKEGDPEVLR